MSLRRKERQRLDGETVQELLLHEENARGRRLSQISKP